MIDEATSTRCKASSRSRRAHRAATAGRHRSPPTNGSRRRVDAQRSHPAARRPAHGVAGRRLREVIDEHGGNVEASWRHVRDLRAHPQSRVEKLMERADVPDVAERSACRSPACTSSCATATWSPCGPRTRPRGVPALFIQDGAVVKSLPSVITRLRDARYADDEIVDWLLREDDSLPGTPIDALRANRGPRSSGARRSPAIEPPRLPADPRRAACSARCRSNWCSACASTRSGAGCSRPCCRSSSSSAAWDAVRDPARPVELRPALPHRRDPARPAAAGGVAVLRRDPDLRGAHVRSGARPAARAGRSHDLHAGWPCSACVAAAALDLLVLRTNLLRHKAFWTAYAIMRVLPADRERRAHRPADRALRPATIIGWRVVYAPVEDLLFGFALITVTLSVWVWLGARAAACRSPVSPTAPRRTRPTVTRRENTS